MIQELKNREDRITEEMAAAFERAQAKSEDCDSVLILMQRKGGGLFYETMPSLRMETVTFLALTFLHSFIASLREER